MEMINRANPNFSIRAKEDFDLVQLALKGEQVAYAKLMSRYKDSIYFLVLKMVHDEDDADDLTMEAFGKAFNNLLKYQPEFAFSTWLYRIALNNCIDWIRRKKLETTSLDTPSENERGEEYQLDVTSEEHDPEEIFVRKQRHKLMRETLDKINPKYKQLIELRFFDELSYEEIADQMKLPLGTVKAQLFRAKNLLYEILHEKKERY